ncbi:uncharacterized protein LOC117170281 [Belonocnema kinseyi]|uniref:uncharacterized protein LOC117170281 n=1 Tax=Belonocnema kinseyi TaxID=2817044 RepID=UPI00143E0383|nr:uncharacterized protein LOC117170281 [Belonocnema kinseyi]
MAPTICMPDFSAIERSQSYSRRRYKNPDGSINKRQRVELKKLPWKSFENSEIYLPHPLSPIAKPICPIDSYLPLNLSSSQKISMRIPSMQNEQWKMVLRRDGLLDIFARTMALVKSNNILQKRVDALREETQNFISSVMRNPENKTSKIEDLSSKENNLVSSSTEIISRSPSPSPSLPKSKIDSESNLVSSSSEADAREDTDC